MQLSNRTYDILKALDLVWIPALTTFYVTIDSIFGWGYGNIVAKVSAAVCTLVRSLIGLSSATYYKNLGDGLYFDGEDSDE
jgi:hypothetical protein